MYIMGWGTVLMCTHSVVGGRVVIKAGYTCSNWGKEACLYFYIWTVIDFCPCPSLSLLFLFFSSSSVPLPFSRRWHNMTTRVDVWLTLLLPCRVFANSVDPDQLASKEANWLSLKYVNFYQNHSNRYGAFFIQKMLISFLFLNKNICCGTHLKRLGEALLMSTYNICFHREIRKILCGYPLLSVAMKTLDQVIWLAGN